MLLKVCIRLGYYQTQAEDPSLDLTQPEDPLQIHNVYCEFNAMDPSH